VEYGTAGTKAATVKHRPTASAVESCGPAVKSATAMEASSTVKATATSPVETTSATAMSTTTTATDYGRQPAGGGLRRRRRTRIDQRQRLRARWNG
jgi:hypothetical protein